MLELLSPAGSMDALRAAVQNGANAVYLGIGTFNARQGAKNFTLETLGEALKYCHVRGVAVHLTLNTLVTDREFKSVAELIRKTAEAGARLHPADGTLPARGAAVRRHGYAAGGAQPGADPGGNPLHLPEFPH